MKKNSTLLNENIPGKEKSKEKILLALLPFWTPQVPPSGISCLKSFLQPRGFEVKTLDVNVEGKLREIYDKYFDTLRKFISETKRGNFYNIGHDVMQNHMMAYLNYTDEKEYIELVKILIFKTFFFQTEDQQVRRLNQIVGEFYSWLEKYFLDLLAKEKPSVLGLSVFKGTLPASMFVFKLARETFPHIKTVMGGAVFSQTLGFGTPNFTAFLEKTRDFIDKIIIGEGEVLFLKLLQGQFPESQRVYTQKDINDKVLDLSTVQVPDFSGLNLRFYPSLASYTSRSCPYQCSFCTETVYWGKYRKKNVKQVAEELSELYNRHRFQLFLMCDSLLNPVLTELAHELINREVSIYWDGYVRIDAATSNPDNAYLWRRGGLYRARLGVESGSQQVLEAMGKKISLQQIKNSISNLANAGIKTTTYWVIGHPGETEENFQETLDLIEELKDDIYEAECNPFGYYVTGQVNSAEWEKKYKRKLLYPGKASDMLLIETWAMDCPPSREETYERVNRFVRHCSKLGIANPYSLYDISSADQRWKKLHRNAVPFLLEFKDRNIYLDENKGVKKILQAENTGKETIEFDF